MGIQEPAQIAGGDEEAPGHRGGLQAAGADLGAERGDGQWAVREEDGDRLGQKHRVAVGPIVWVGLPVRTRHRTLASITHRGKCMAVAIPEC